MKIYTKKGDEGTTWLFGGGPYPKDDLRITAYGEVDELNSVLGCALCETEDFTVRDVLQSLQRELFQAGSELACLNPSEKMIEGFIQASHTHKLEKQIDQMEAELTSLTHFILPGGHKAAALLHLARTVCRRAERSVVKLSHHQEIRADLMVYLNRLSDFLFVLARLANSRAKVPDVLWEGLEK